MEIEFTLQKSDLLALAQYQAEHSSQFQKRESKFRWSYTLAFSLIAIGNYILYPNTIIAIIFAILAILSAVFYPYLHKWRVQRYLVKKVEKNSRPDLFTNRKICLTAEGLESISESIENKVKWPLVDKVDITPTHTFISVGGTYSFIIPKSGITTGNYDDFVAALRASTQIKR